MANEASVSVSTSAASVVAPNPGQTVIIQNAGASLVYVGTDSSVTVNSGIALAPLSGNTPGGAISVSYGSESTPDTWYAVAAASGNSVHYLLIAP
jgi:hypothetical protein